MPREHVDEPALAELAEGHLNARVPSQRRELAGNRLDEAGVVRRRESMQVTVPRPRHKIEANIECSPDSAHGPEAERLAPAALDARDGLAGNAGGRREIDLAPAAADANGTEDRADALIVHDPHYRKAPFADLSGLR